MELHFPRNRIIIVGTEFHVYKNNNAFSFDSRAIDKNNSHTHFVDLFSTSIYLHSSKYYRAFSELIKFKQNIIFFFVSSYYSSDQSEKKILLIVEVLKFSCELFEMEIHPMCV